MMASRTETFQSRLDMTCAPSAMRFARDHTKNTLLAWGLPHEVLDDALLIVAELATNAVRHVAVPALDGDQQASRCCALVLAAELGTLHIAFHDGGDQPPVLRRGPLLEESGRGLRLIAGLTDGAWGWRPLTPPPGKVVWATITIPEYRRRHIPPGEASPGRPNTGQPEGHPRTTVGA